LRSAGPRDRGTLNVGAPADVALLELRKGTFEFLDNYNSKRRRSASQVTKDVCHRLKFVV
jgi:predicted amidohydrolase